MPLVEFKPITDAYNPIEVYKKIIFPLKILDRTHKRTNQKSKSDS